MATAGPRAICPLCRALTPLHPRRRTFLPHTSTKGGGWCPGPRGQAPAAQQSTKVAPRRKKPSLWVECLVCGRNAMIDPGALRYLDHPTARGSGRCLGAGLSTVRALSEANLARLGLTRREATRLAREISAAEVSQSNGTKDASGGRRREKHPGTAPRRAGLLGNCPVCLGTHPVDRTTIRFADHPNAAGEVCRGSRTVAVGRLDAASVTRTGLSLVEVRERRAVARTTELAAGRTRQRGPAPDGWEPTRGPRTVSGGLPTLGRRR